MAKNKENFGEKIKSASNTVRFNVEQQLKRSNKINNQIRNDKNRFFPANISQIYIVYVTYTNMLSNI